MLRQRHKQTSFNIFKHELIRRGLLFATHALESKLLPFGTCSNAESGKIRSHPPDTRREAFFYIQGEHRRVD